MSLTEIKVGTTYHNCKGHMVTIFSKVVPCDLVTKQPDETKTYFTASNLRKYDEFGSPIPDDMFPDSCGCLLRPIGSMYATCK